ncbi:MAG: transporter, partial [Sphingopyxis terrae]
AASEAQAAAAQLSAVRFDVQEMADGDLARAAAAYSAWQRADQARAAQMAALAKLRRGQDLDAIDLADVLLGGRQTHASFRAETIARTEALRDITRLRIDSHNLWISE